MTFIDNKTKNKSFLNKQFYRFLWKKNKNKNTTKNVTDRNLSQNNPGWHNHIILFNDNSIYLHVNITISQ